MVYGGVDPGKKGGFSLIDGETMEAETHAWDDAAFVQRMQELQNSGKQCVVCVEKVGAMPGQGIAGMFRFGQSFGFITGVLAALDIPFQLIPPQTWKKEFSLIHQEKSKSIETAQRLFPGVNLIPPGCRKPSDGCGESLLMAAYAMRKFGASGEHGV